ncbi:hypothetical protein KKB40_00535 [Patescibacteria group bacterium]|nr:hypothetical protein [Patescibacteria group bacterium]
MLAILRYNDFIVNKTLDEVVKSFIEKGGRVNPFYLTNPKRNPVLVFYKRWFRGRNVREAIKRALAN